MGMQLAVGFAAPHWSGFRLTMARPRCTVSPCLLGLRSRKIPPWQASFDGRCQIPSYECAAARCARPTLALRRFALPLPLRREFILPLPLGPGAGLPLPLQRFTLSFVPSPPGESTDRPHLGFRTARRRRRRKNGTKIVGNSPLLLTTIRLPARALVLPLPLRPSLDLPLPLRPHAILPLPPNPSWGVDARAAPKPEKSW